jgi:hypothetical protein
MTMNVDPVTIMAGVNWSVQLIGLLSAWKQDRKATSDDNFQNFILWLENHNFHALRERIYESDELNRDLHSLMANSIEQIGAKLDELSSAVSLVASKIDGLRSIDRAVFADANTVSTQAREILRFFSDADDSDRMCHGIYGAKAEHVLHLLPSKKTLRPSEQKFVKDDIDALVAADLISLSKFNRRQNPIYVLTRKGAALAGSFPSGEIVDGPK